MRLRYKLILAMLFVAAAPIGIAGYQAFEQSRAAVEEGIRELLAKTSHAEAEIIGRRIGGQLKSLRLVAGAMNVELESLSGLSQNLTRVYLLSDSFNAAALFDSRGGQIGPAIFVDDRASFSAEYRAHEELDGAELQTFLAAARTASMQGARISKVYVSRRKRVPLVVLGVALSSEGKRYSLAVEFSLARLQKRIERLRVGRKGFAFLVDSTGRLVLHRDRAAALSRADVGRLSILAGRLGSTNAAVSNYSDPSLGSMLGAFAPVPGTSFSIVVAQPLNEALKPVNELGLRLVSWLLVGLAFAGLIGLIIAGHITRPVHELMRGANAIASGELAHEIEVKGKDEIGVLGKTFNHMGAELRKNQARIAQQTEEIKRWNVELQDRVEARTRELQRTQEQLVQAQKMAAMGELGAGVAHEVNNPLMGVLGCSQLLLTRHTPGDSDHQMLTDIEREAQRIRVIVGRLLESSQSGAAGMGRVNLKGVIENTVAEHKDNLVGRGVRVEMKIQARLPQIMGASESLGKAISELLVNAAKAMPRGGRIRLSASGSEGHLVKIQVADTGVGIKPENIERIFEPFFTTKQDWDGKGLGLSNVYRIVSEHQGKIDVRSEPGRGCVFTITFPALRHSAHLR
ncbi:MAG TPA: ATP-binding protein [Myxococcota bacterium]|nr:ATP-binding protein [Myxococcota bacterium]